MQTGLREPVHSRKEGQEIVWFFEFSIRHACAFIIAHGVCVCVCACVRVRAVRTDKDAMRVCVCVPGELSICWNVSKVERVSSFCFLCRELSPCLRVPQELIVCTYVSAHIVG
jgi:hypothetical protein